MLRRPVRSSAFRRDVKRAQKRGKDTAKLRRVISLLLAGEPLPEQYKAHPLRGIWKAIGMPTSSLTGCSSTVSSATSFTWSGQGRTPSCSRGSGVGVLSTTTLCKNGKKKKK